MHSRRAALVLAVALAAGGLSTARAASHRDWTPVPLGSFKLQDGAQTIQLARPYDCGGVIGTPITFTALFDPGQPLSSPIEIGMTIDGRALPPWKVQQLGQAYVIGLSALEQGAATQPANGASPGQSVVLEVTVRNAAAGLVLMASGMPEIRLAGDDAAGPLEDIVKRLPPGVAREYLNATVYITGGQLQMAKADFGRLARGSDEAVARFARAALRRIRFAESEARLQPGFGPHYRLGLYAQQCGMFRAARLHFQAALAELDNGQPRPHPHAASDAWYRLGETMERCGEPVGRVAEVMERAGAAAEVVPNTWDVWVPILAAQEHLEQRNGETVPVRVALSSEHIERVKQQWQRIAQMVYGASGGYLKLATRFDEIADPTQAPYEQSICGLYGPRDELVTVPGSFDCVMSYRPRGSDTTAGADCGPNGAGLSDVAAGSNWATCLGEWCRQFDWTVRAAEVGTGFPTADHVGGCGHQPIPSVGYGHLARLRYHLTPAMYLRLEPADPDNWQGYLRSWWIGPPTAISKLPPRDQLPGHHAAEYPPAAFADASRRFVTVEGDFVDLKTLVAGPGPALPNWFVVPATAYVLSPQRQEVRLWLGHNDGLALWLNNELVHRGDYYAAGKWADQNRPNMVAISAVLLKGWNRLDVTVESWPAPHDQGCGFAVRICDFANQPVEGLVAADARTKLPAAVLTDTLRPQPGRFYRWDEVRDDFYRRLPRLTEQSLREYARLDESFRITGSIGATTGYVALGSPADRIGQERGGVALRPPPAEWDQETNFDTRLNNVLDWNREAVAVYPFNTEPPARHLLLMRPEAVDAYLTCLEEAPPAMELYQGRTVRDRILGYVIVGGQGNDEAGARVLIVAETCLPTPLPADEEDLLLPLEE